MTPAKVAISLVCLCLCLITLYLTCDLYPPGLRANRESQSYLNQLLNEIHNADQINVVERSVDYDGVDTTSVKHPKPIPTRRIVLDTRQKIELSKIIQGANPAPNTIYWTSISEIYHTIEFIQKGKIHSILSIGFFSEVVEWYTFGPSNDKKYIGGSHYPKDLVPLMRQWIRSIGLNPDAQEEAGSQPNN